MVTGVSQCPCAAGLFSVTGSRLNVTGISIEATRTLCTFSHFNFIIITLPRQMLQYFLSTWFSVWQSFYNILSGQLLLIWLSVCHPFHTRYNLSICISCSQSSSQYYYHCLFLINDVTFLPLPANTAFFFPFFFVCVLSFSELLRTPSNCQASGLTLPRPPCP